jgi:hypothetical protein
MTSVHSFGNPTLSLQCFVPVNIGGHWIPRRWQPLYRRAVYKDCRPFGSYKHSPIRLFPEKTLHRLDVADAQSNVPRAARPGWRQHDATASDPLRTFGNEMSRTG